MFFWGRDGYTSFWKGCCSCVFAQCKAWKTRKLPPFWVELRRELITVEDSWTPFVCIFREDFFRLNVFVDASDQRVPPLGFVGVIWGRFRRSNKSPLGVPWPEMNLQTALEKNLHDFRANVPNIGRSVGFLIHSKWEAMNRGHNANITGPHGSCSYQRIELHFDYDYSCNPWMMDYRSRANSWADVGPVATVIRFMAWRCFEIH